MSPKRDRPCKVDPGSPTLPQSRKPSHLAGTSTALHDFSFSGTKPKCRSGPLPAAVEAPQAWPMSRSLVGTR
jgi:hypothetical protein